MEFRLACLSADLATNVAALMGLVILYRLALLCRLLPRAEGTGAAGYA